MSMTRFAAVALVPLALSLFAKVPTAQATNEPYAGKTLTILVHSDGGSYALYARTLAEHMRRHIPGNPSIIVQSMPGAGGMTAANYLYNAAPKDGGHAGMIVQTLPIQQLLGAPGARFDVTRMQWIGNMLDGISTIAVWHQAPATDIAGMRQNEVIAGSTGRGSETYLFPLTTNMIAGTRFRVVTGYKGIADIEAAMERGEAHSLSTAWAGLKARRSDWIRDNKLIPAVQIGLRKNPDLPDVPLLVDLVQTEDERLIAEFMSGTGNIGRSLSLPPGVPEEHVAILRRAFDATMQDPQLRADMERRNMELSPVSWQEIVSVIEKMGALPEPLRKRLLEELGYSS